MHPRTGHQVALPTLHGLSQRTKFPPHHHDIWSIHEHRGVRLRHIASASLAVGLASNLPRSLGSSSRLINGIIPPRNNDREPNQLRQIGKRGRDMCGV